MMKKTRKVLSKAYAVVLRHERFVTSVINLIAALTMLYKVSQ